MEGIMRWYDLEPDVCMAISMIEIADDKTKNTCAMFIIEQIKLLDTEYNFIRNCTIENLNCNYTRWYDQDDQLSMAFRYMKATTKSIQKDVARAILTYINSTAYTS